MIVPKPQTCMKKPFDLRKIAYLHIDILIYLKIMIKKIQLYHFNYLLTIIQSNGFVNR